MKHSRWSESYRHYLGWKPGQALVKWLNEHPASPSFIETVLSEAQLVFEWVGSTGAFVT